MITYNIYIVIREIIIISSCEQSIAESRSVKEILPASMSQHSSATANRNKLLHRNFLSACYLSRLCFSGEQER